MGEVHLIALGANLPSPAGAPRATLTAALDAIAARGLTISARSRWFTTPAFPVGSGPDFVNGAAVLQSDAEPTEVLAVLHEVERELGRERDRRWEPRVCDLDLLASGDRVLPDRETARRWLEAGPDRKAAAPPGLVLPHPRLHERAFVLVPVADVAPDWRHPLLGRTVRELLAALPAEATDGIVAL